MRGSSIKGTSSWFWPTSFVSRVVFSWSARNVPTVEMNVAVKSSKRAPAKNSLSTISISSSASSLLSVPYGKAVSGYASY